MGALAAPKGYKRCLSGSFNPRNPKKYKGDPRKIYYRSSYELEFMKFCDSNPNVLMWSSEEIYIPYVSPIDKQLHKYYPDFLIKVKNIDKSEDIILIEIKPFSQTRKPINKKKGKPSKRLINEHATYMVNTAKWRAASEWCKQRNITFKIVTEKEIFKDGKRTDKR